MEAFLNETQDLRENTSLIEDVIGSSDSEVTASGDEGVIRFCFSCRILAISLYTTLSIVGFVGNALIVGVILYFRRLRTATNYLILNLAVAGGYLRK